MAQIILFFPIPEEKDNVLLPASVLMVAAPLVEKGYQVKIIDQRVDKNWSELLLKELKKQPLIVGFSALTGKQIFYALQATKIVKENSQARTVWGGVHPSLLPKQTLENRYIDFVVVGEWEETVLELVQALENGSPLNEIKGLAYKKNNIIHFNPPREFIDLDKLPAIPYHLVALENYIAKRSFASGQPGRDIAFYTSRGCPYRCKFCYNQEFSKRRWRGKSAERVIEEMERLIKDYGITSFEIEDDEFFINLNRVREISQLILKKNLKIDISTCCRVDRLAKLMDNEFLKLIYRAGFKKLSFGVESGSKKIQELIHKDIENWQAIETVKKMAQVGITAKFCFMAGFPQESISDLLATCDLIQKMKRLDRNISIPAWRVFTPYPGTELYDLAIQEGFEPPQSLGEWTNYNFEIIKMPWLSSPSKRIIRNVSYLIDFLELPLASRAGLYLKLGRLYGKTVDFRWQRHLFWAPEKYLIKAIQRFHQAIKNE